MSLGKIPTRNSSICPLLGVPTELSPVVLPTNAEVMRKFLLVRNQTKGLMTNKDPPASLISKKVVESLVIIWNKSSIPIISNKKIVEKITKLNNEYRKILKPYKGRKESESYKKKLDDLKCMWEQTLFDIACCKCDNFESCCCSKERKVPVNERTFLTDQRSTRTLIIGPVDTTTSKQLKKKQERKIRDQNRKTDLNTLSSTEMSYWEEFESSYSSENEEREEEGKEEEKAVSEKSYKLSSSCISHNIDPQPCSSASGEYSKGQMRQKLSTFSRECDRHGVSDRAAASLSSALMQDLGLVCETNTEKVIDRNKVRRERERHRKELQANISAEVQGLYFDGRKDKTRTQTKKGDKYYGSIVKEEHISLIQEPNCVYLGHLTVSSGSAASIKNGILNFFIDKGISTDSLIAIGCDGTVVNTGTKAGVLSLLEAELNRPLQWFICMLHLNELPLRHLLVQLDGVTHGPKAFSGEIGKLLQTCHTLPVTKFRKIEGNQFPDVDRNILSTDQRYLLDMLNAVSSGKCNQDLAAIQPGPVVHSRWLTTANRILRLYVATENPSENFLHLVTYIMKVYGPIWFHIKVKPLCIEGSKHLWKLIMYSRYMPDHLRKTVDVVIQRNGFFAHMENLLLAMLFDNRDTIRKLAWSRVISARKQNQNSSSVRNFRVPIINMQATDYIDLIFWSDNNERLEPPVLNGISDEDLGNIVSNENASTQFPYLSSFPCHTQGTERCVKLVTEAASLVCGEKRRDGFIRSRLESRNIMKCFDTKSEFRFK
jgi:hypothetical protein